MVKGRVRRNVRKCIIRTILQMLVWLVLLIVGNIILYKIEVHSCIQFIWQVVLPVIVGTLGCLWLYRKQLRFGKRFSKVALKELLVSVGTVLVLVLGSLVLELLDVGNQFANLFSGENAQMIAYALCYMNVYLIAGIFPLSYHVVKFLFVE